MKITKTVIGCICSIGCLVNTQFAEAALNDNWQDSRLQAKDRQNRLEQSRVQLDADASGTLNNGVSTAGDAVCFPIRTVKIINQMEKFIWLEQYLRKYAGKEYSLSGINQLVNDINRVLVRRGFATTRVVVPEQNIAQGTLLLVLEEGRIGKVTARAGAKKVYWKSAFPFREGDILNIRDIEQGIEQMKRLPNQEVKVKLIPSEQQGYTDISLEVKRGRNIYGSIAFDDSGLESTGKYQWFGNLAWDNLLNQQDTLRIGINLDGTHSGYEKGTREQDVFYSIPYGRSTFSVAYQQSKYHQQMKMEPITFQNAGKSDLTKFTWDYVLHRTGSMKNSMDVSIRKRNSHSYINDMEIPVQALHATAMEVGYAERLYLGQAMAYFRLGHRFGVDWLGAQQDYSYDGAPSTKYNMWLLDADFRQPFELGHRSAVFTTSFHGQWTMDDRPLYGVDRISMGNRYTVRGFSGKYTLMAGNGWFLRNEVANQLPRCNSQLYLGADVGSVYGDGSEEYQGHALVGCVLGLRGNWGKDIRYDTFVSKPLRKPAGFDTSKVTGGISLVCSI